MIALAIKEMFSMNYFRRRAISYPQFLFSQSDCMTGRIRTLACLALASLLLSSVQPGLAALEISPAIAKQGQTIEVLVPKDGATAGGDSSVEGTVAGDSSSPAPTVNFNKKDYRTFPHQKGETAFHRALISIPADMALGTFTIKCGDSSEKVKVVAGGFGVQSIRLPKGKDNFAASPGEEAAVDGAKATVSNKQYWDGKFLRPVQSRISSTFGLRRRVNGKLLTDYFHSGLDFAAATGTPVKAVQRGKVILARHGWKLHGNTICIDHGLGVISFYIHLSKVLVKEGDIVDAGQKIGAVGSTGRANGPHLHFSIYVNKDATNPGDWFAKAF